MLEIDFDKLDRYPTVLNYGAESKQIESTKGSLQNVSVAVLRNFTVDPIKITLPTQMSKFEMGADLHIYEDYQLESLIFDAGSDLYKKGVDFILLLLSLEEMAPLLARGYLGLSAKNLQIEITKVADKVKTYISEIRKRTKTVILINNFYYNFDSPHGIFDAVYPTSHRKLICEINDGLADLVRTTKDCVVIDFNSVFARNGEERCFDSRQWSIAKQPFKFYGYHAISKEISKVIKSFNTPSKKCLVLDCDNTLWGGVLGEDGPNGVALGDAYPGNCFRDFQRSIIDLKNKGVFITLCSKNNESDVIDFIEGSGRMFLNLDDVATFRVNWEDKATNIKSIASELNIGLDAMVFIDDSEFECSWVKSQLPEVEVIQLDPNFSAYSGLLSRSGLFDSRSLTEEDKNRTEMFKGAKKSDAEISKFASFEEFLMSLELVVDFSVDEVQLVKRISQMTNKTNQFNFRTKRYSETDIVKMIDAADKLVLTARLKDKNTDYGIIGLVILKFNGDSAFVDTFLMSCRALSRDVDKALLVKVVNICKERGLKKLDGEYIPTNKNIIVVDWFKNMGFVSQGGDPASWSLSFGVDTEPQWPDHINEMEMNKNV